MDCQSCLNFEDCRYKDEGAKASTCSYYIKKRTRPQTAPEQLVGHIVADFDKLNREERKLVYRFVRAVVSRDTEAIKRLTSLVEKLS